MITKSDAVKIGKAITDVARRVSEPNLLPATRTPAPETPEQAKLRHMGRGTCIYALDNLWYDVLPNKVKEQFNYSKDAFYKECGWPD